MNYVPLNIKTDNTILSSMIRIKPLIKKAKELNLKALTITDNNLYGTIEFYKECKKENIKPIIGLELNINQKIIIIYSRNYQGYLNLIKLATLKTEKEITLNDLNQYSDNTLCIMPYETRILYNDLKKIYEYLFIGYKNEIQKSKIKSSNTVYMNEILTLTKEDEPYLKYLYAIKHGKQLKDMNFLPQNKTLTIKEEPNNKKIIDLCNLEIKFHNNLLPHYPCQEDSYTHLKQKCIAGAKKHFGKQIPQKYVTRLKKELTTINQMGFCDYFLIVQDYVNYAKTNDILVGPGRGSAAGSLVAYLLGITEIDPLKYGLLFERFLNKERVTMPDIDIDFEDEKREEVINYCIKKYGNKKVAPIITFSTLKSKAAIRDIGKVLNIDSHKIDILCSCINPKETLGQNLQNPNIKKILSFNKELKPLYQIALKIEGIKRQTGIHAAGIIMSNKNLDEVIPLEKSRKEIYIAGYTMEYLEEIGLLKMDFLGLKNLSIINKILKEINIKFEDIKENDPKALNIFKTGNTLGIFQFESEGMKNFLIKYKPDTFEDVSSAIALFRPGPLRNIDTYIKRKRGIEKIDYIHKDLEKILKPTYGIIIYQEQIMQIASTMAGYTLSEADNLRRAMSKKKEDILLKEKDKFINQSIQKGYSKEIATKIYTLILRFADYGFNRSHSIAYAMISYKMAYLKAHYPEVFLKTFLNEAINSEEKTKEYIYECKKIGIIIQNPDINQSEDKYIIKNNKIIYPLTNIKNIQINTIKEIIKERQNKPFKDIFDFVIRCKKIVNQKTLENLILSGAFDKLGINRKTLINNLEIIINYSSIGLYLDETLKPELEIQEEYTKEEIAQSELTTFGFYLTNHPITKYKLKYPNIPLNDIKSHFDKQVNIIIQVSRTNKITTKKSEEMMFITGKDELNEIDIVIFPKIYKTYGNFKEGDILYINGKVEKRFDKYQIIATKLKKIN